MRLSDGYRSLITFAEQDTVKLWEKDVTPPGIEGGDGIDTTTMHNNTWKTQVPKTLIEMTDSAMSCAYDPAVYNDIVQMVNLLQEITVTFPDGAQIVFWGWLNSFKPGRNGIGQEAVAEVSIKVANQNAAGQEVAPRYIPG